MSKIQELRQERRMRKIEEENNKPSMVVRPSVGGRIADVVMVLILAAVALVCIVPLWHVTMASISDGYSLLSHAGTVWKPIGEATLAGYKLLFSDSSVLTGYLNSCIYVVGGTLLGLLMNIFAGYILSRPTKLRVVMILYCVITTMFSGGTVPTYMVIRSLGMTGTRWSLIIPGCTNAIFMLLMMNAFSQVDKSYIEAAEIDGAGHLNIMFQVMWPQCKGMAVVTAINTAILKWNAWFEASVYVPNNRECWPLQLWVKTITASAQDFLKSTNPNYDNSVLPNGDFDRSGMNSLNHYAYGSIGSWLYERVAGIRALEPGYHKILLAPMLTKGITQMSASYESIYGTIKSAWSCKDGKISVDVTVPANTTAEVQLPEKEETILLGSGSYHYEYATKTCLERERYTMDSTLGELLATDLAKKRSTSCCPECWTAL